METLNLEKFSPQKAELVVLASKYRSLEIAGVDDVTGYAMVDVARKDLKAKRVTITKTGKELRQEALDFQRGVIALEKELIAIIEPLEDELENKQNKIKEEKLKIERQILLPARKEKLAKIDLVITDDELLSMSPEDFQQFYNLKNTEYLEEKERKIKETEAKLAREKELEEARKKAREEAEVFAQKEAERKAKEAKEREVQLKKDAEENTRKAVEEAERKAREEKQRLIDEQKQKDEMRIAEEKHKQREIERLAEEEKKQKERIEKGKRYKKFLTENGCTNENKEGFHIIATETEVILYKKIATFIL